MTAALINEVAPDRLTILAERLGVRREISESALVELTWAFLKYSPFHNIDLLAGAAGVPPPLSEEEALERVSTGRGGPCHVQAAAFLALVHHLGYDAHLAA